MYCRFRQDYYTNFQYSILNKYCLITFIQKFLFGKSFWQNVSIAGTWMFIFRDVTDDIYSHVAYLPTGISYSSSTRLDAATVFCGDASWLLRELSLLLALLLALPFNWVVGDVFLTAGADSSTAVTCNKAHSKLNIEPHNYVCGNVFMWHNYVTLMHKILVRKRIKRTKDARRHLYGYLPGEMLFWAGCVLIIKLKQVKFVSFSIFIYANNFHCSKIVHLRRVGIWWFWRLWFCIFLQCVWSSLTFVGQLIDDCF